MRKAGPVVLSLWAGLNLLVAAVVTLSTLLDRAPPALSLMLTQAEIRALDPRVLAVIKAQAALANPLIIVVCVWVLVLAFRDARAAVLPFAATLLPLQAFAFISDGFLGGRNLAANGVSTALLVAGLSLSRRAV
jgi:hypothetical protein